MSKQNIVSAYEQSTKIKEIVKQLQQDKNHFQISNLVGSSLSFVISTTFKKTEKPFLLIFNDKEEAAYYLNDLEQLVGEKNVLFYPGSYRRPYQIEQTDNANILLRAEVLNRINSRKKPAIIVTYPDALFEQVITKRELEKNTLKLSVGEEVSLDFVNEILFEYHFKRSDFVTEPGEFSVRGGIIDVFSFSNDEPYRIEFFGNEVDSIRTFDIETQLSSEKLTKINIMPNVENKLLDENRESFLKYIHSKTVVFAKNTNLLTNKLDTLFEKAESAFKILSAEIKHGKPHELFCNGALIQSQLKDFLLVEINNLPIYNLLVMFMFFFIGGYLLYSSLYAAIGAAVDNETDTQQFMLPILMPLILGMYVGFFTVIDNPHGIVSQVFSYIPLTSPVVMLMRIPFGVPIWQQILSLVILFATFIGTVWFASKIYRVGILMYGKKASYREIIKWLKY